MTNHDIKQIARAFHTAAQCHTAGYDSENNTHKYSVKGACVIACIQHGLPLDFAEFMAFALNEQWNTVLEWADKIKLGPDQL